MSICKFAKIFIICTNRSPRGGGGVLRISSDGDDRRIFLGLKFSIPGFFGVGKFGKFLARFPPGPIHLLCIHFATQTLFMLVLCVRGLV